MNTGPWHYAEAERLIREADSIPGGFPSDRYAQTIAAAQVHATLAVADATAAGVILGRGERDEWDQATGRGRWAGPEATP